MLFSTEYLVELGNMRFYWRKHGYLYFLYYSSDKRKEAQLNLL